MAPGWSEDAKLGSGLADRYLLTISKAYVGHPWEKNPTAAAVIFEGERNVEGEIEDAHLWLKVGAFDGGDKDGTFLVHEQQTPEVYDDPSSKKKKLNKNSGYGKFLKSFEDVAGLDVLADNQAADRSKYEIWDVLFWQGLIVDVEEVEEGYDFKNDAGEQIKGEKRQAYVREFVGKADGSVPSATTAASSVPATTGSSNGTVDPKTFDSFIAYLEAYVGAGGGSGDEAAKKEFYELARS